MKNNTNKAVSSEPVETASLTNAKAVEFKVTGSGDCWIVQRAQGAEFKHCDANGLWAEVPKFYRNEEIAKRAAAYFEVNS
jgi:hypothetical protein